MVYDFKNFSEEELNKTEYALNERLKIKMNLMIFDEDFGSIVDRLDAIELEKKSRAK